MKLKIFNAIVLSLLVIAATGRAQGLTKAQEKQLEKNMQRLNSKMNELQKHFNSSKFKESFKHKELAYNDFGKNFAEGFKDFGNDFKDFGNDVKDLGQNFSREFKNSEHDQKADDEKDLVEKVKKISKSYAIGAGDKLQIENQYGKVAINVWNKNEFKVDVEIKAAAKDASTAQKLVDGVEIDDSKNGSVVSFKTSRSNDDSRWGNWGRGNVRKLEINYTIYMPSRNALDVTNRYGATILPDFAGKVDINTAYGSFSAKSLTNTANDINVRYGSANIEELTGGSLNVAYGSLNLLTGEKLDANISYGSAKIGTIKGSGNIDIRYCGGFKIGGLDKSLKNLSINAAYSSIALAVDDKDNFDFDISVNYAGFSYDDGRVTVTSKSPSDEEHGWHSNKTYKGHVGKGNSGAKVTIRSNYGGVKFN